MSKGGNQQQQPKRRTKSSTTKFTIPKTKVQCQILLNRLTIKFFNCAFYIADKAMYILGPILICLASGIISGLTYVYFYIVLPMLCGVNWIYTRSDYDMYWKERGYTVSRPSLNSDADNGEEEERISKLTTIFIALSTPTGIFNTLIVTFFLYNILYNYYKCVTTSNSGPNYKVVVREIAQVTNFNYPETNEELVQCKKDQEKKIYYRMQRKRNELMAARGTPIRPGEPSNSAENKDEESQQQTSASSSQSTPLMAATTSNAINKKKEPPKPLPKIHNWQLLSPTEWSYCRYSHQPKPPRSHYDHVTKSLILNMDHYCPWMFNCIGYFNYRYFFNFLWFVIVALFYGAIICYKPFMLLGTKEYRDQVKLSGGYTNQLNVYRNGKQLVLVKHIQSNSFIPIPTEKTSIALGFMLCLCLALAVMCLGIFHLYLLTSAQSTIEFHGNMSKRKRKGWKNPYSAGSWKKNWELTYGTRYWYLKNKCSCCAEDENGMNGEDEDDEKYSYRGILGILMAMMPSNREPEFLPLPINGKLVRRNNRNVDTKKTDLEMGTVSTDGSTSDQESEEFIMQSSKDTNGLVGRASRSSK